jgi:Fur family transcriptional regulator, ferric uptake regulator
MNAEEMTLASPVEIDRAEELLRQHLRLVGMKNTKQRSAIVRAFLRAQKPVTAHDLLYLVKKDDVFIAFGTVYRTLKTIVACGLGREVASPDGAIRYEHEHNRCLHRHLVCKDCGAMIAEQKES